MFKYQTIESLVGPTKKKIDWKLLRTNRLCQCISITKRNSIYRNEFNQRFGITIAFLATHSGLIRWMNFQKPINNYVADSQPQYVFFILFRRFWFQISDSMSLFLFPLIIAESQRWALFDRWTKFGTNEPSNSIPSRMKVSSIQCHSMKVRWITISHSIIFHSLMH